MSDPVPGSCSGLKPGRHAVAQRQIFTAQGPHQDLQPAILVEDDLRRAASAQHRHQKADQYGLARSGRSADERVPGVLAAAAVRIARIARVQREMIRRARAGHKSRQRIAPVIARRPSGRIVVERRHRGKVARGDRRLARPHEAVAGQLRPERRLQRQILARHGHAGVGEQAARQRHLVVERLEPLRGARLRALRPVPPAPAATDDDRPSRTRCW